MRTDEDDKWYLPILFVIKMYPGYKDANKISEIQKTVPLTKPFNRPIATNKFSKRGGPVSH